MSNNSIMPRDTILFCIYLKFKEEAVQITIPGCEVDDSKIMTADDLEHLLITAWRAKNIRGSITADLFRLLFTLELAEMTKSINRTRCESWEDEHTFEIAKNAFANENAESGSFVNWHVYSDTDRCQDPPVLVIDPLKYRITKCASYGFAC